LSLLDFPKHCKQTRRWYPCKHYQHGRAPLRFPTGKEFFRERPSTTLAKGTTVRFTSTQLLEDGVLERAFSLGNIPGLLWVPPSTPAPLILMGHPGGLAKMYPRLLTRARSAAALGFAAATIEVPGGGERPRLAAVDRARAELHQTLQAGKPVPDAIVDRLILPMVDASVPEWQAALDALLAVPEIEGSVGYSGGVISVGTRLVAIDPRISAAVFFSGSARGRTAGQDSTTRPVAMGRPGK
jgi:hypothetical protein